MPAGSDPAEVAESRETIRLAFVAALQHLPPKQRAVLILREVLRWQAAEVAELLDTTVASVNSALQRARATLRRPTSRRRAAASDGRGPAPLLARYVDAFERYDMDALTSLLHEDATWSMPPYALWLQTHDDIAAWCLGPGIGCRGSRLVPTAANGSPAFAQYKPSGPQGGHGLGAAGARGLRRPDRGHQLLPRHRARCSRSSGCPTELDDLTSRPNGIDVAEAGERPAVDHSSAPGVAQHDADTRASSAVRWSRASARP